MTNGPTARPYAARGRPLAIEAAKNSRNRSTAAGPRVDDHCRPCRRRRLHEDQSDLANWTRGDRRARFEHTAERHAGLSQVAAPF